MDSRLFSKFFTLSLILLFSLPLSAYGSGFGGGGATGSFGGGLVPSIGMPFGGKVIGIPIPCTAPPGAFKIILGPPHPGIYMYQAGLTKTHLYGPPLRPGQSVIGRFIPGVCVVALIPIPVKLMTMVGSSNPLGI